MPDTETARVLMDRYAYGFVKELLRYQFGGVTDPNRVRRNPYFLGLERMTLEYEDAARQGFPDA